MSKNKLPRPRMAIGAASGVMRLSVVTLRASVLANILFCKCKAATLVMELYSVGLLLSKGRRLSVASGVASFCRKQF